MSTWSAFLVDMIGVRHESTHPGWDAAQELVSLSHSSAAGLSRERQGNLTIPTCMFPSRSTINYEKPWNTNFPTLQLAKSLSAPLLVNSDQWCSAITSTKSTIPASYTNTSTEILSCYISPRTTTEDGCGGIAREYAALATFCIFSLAEMIPTTTANLYSGGLLTIYLRMLYDAPHQSCLLLLTMMLFGEIMLTSIVVKCSLAV